MTGPVRPALIVSLLILAFGTVPAVLSSASTPWRGSLEDRIAAQRAVEAVYWSHRIWPAENPQPKPPLADVLPQEILRARVEDSLRKESALRHYWKRTIDERELQSEIDRMARNSKDPSALQELWSALGNDPVRVAEVLARPRIIDRAIRDLYAFDGRFHGAERARAERDLSAGVSADRMRRMSGLYRETVYEAGDVPASDPTVIRLDEKGWRETMQEVSRSLSRGEPVDAFPLRVMSPLRETQSGLYVIAVLEQGPRRLRIGSVTWPKTSFDDWWRSERASFTVLVPEPGKHLRLPALSSPCVAGTWSRMDPDMPTPRSLHTAVWTGSEMLIWGGVEGTDLDEGFRYDPSMDTWTPMSVTGVGEGSISPSGRARSCSSGAATRS